MNDEKTQKISEEVTSFLKKMLYESGEYDYGEEIPEELLQDLSVKLDDWISTYLLDHLTPEKLEVYKELNEKGTSEDILDVFLMKNIENYKDIMKIAYKDFYNNYLEKVHEERESNLI